MDNGLAYSEGTERPDTFSMICYCVTVTVNLLNDVHPSTSETQLID